MNKIYIIFLETEDSTKYKIYGAWKDKNSARGTLKELVEKDKLFNKKSNINLEKGIAESDPEYNEENYHLYVIKEFVLN